MNGMPYVLPVAFSSVWSFSLSVKMLRGGGPVITLPNVAIFAASFSINDSVIREDPCLVYRRSTSICRLRTPSAQPPQPWMVLKTNVISGFRHGVLCFLLFGSARDSSRSSKINEKQSFYRRPYRRPPGQFLT